MFEMLLLETFQAGLSWRTILNKRNNFRRVFHQFKEDAVAKMTDVDVERLMQDASIIRNRLKIRAAISNAQAVMRLREDNMGLAEYFWKFADFRQVDGCVGNGAPSRSTSELSDRVAKDLKKRGFRFVGSTVIYAHLQACGIVNDHHVQCPQYLSCKKLAGDVRNVLNSTDS